MTARYKHIERIEKSLHDLKELYSQVMTEETILRNEKTIYEIEAEIEQYKINKEEHDLKLRRVQKLSLEIDSSLSSAKKAKKEAEEALSTLTAYVETIVRKYGIGNIAERMMDKKRFREDTTIQNEYEFLRAKLIVKHQQVLAVEKIDLKAVRLFIDKEYGNTTEFELFKISLNFYNDIDILWD
ncbi:hypothetical protein QEL91_002016 [Pseudomonas putida]|nr:hypothetical protein [Pseudomonas putida]